MSDKTGQVWFNGEPECKRPHAILLFIERIPSDDDIDPIIACVQHKIAALETKASHFKIGQRNSESDTRFKARTPIGLTV